MQLRDYQRQGVEFLKARKYALLADDPGLGKTAQAIVALRENQTAVPILIICPAQVKYQWQNQFNIWWPGRKIQIITSSTEKILSTAEVVIINYDLLIRTKLFYQCKYRQWLIVCDEAHRLKNRQAKRTKCILLDKGLRGNAKSIWFLTGTPVKNRPIDLFAMLHHCAIGLITPYHTYEQFAFRYCGAYQTPFGLDVQGASRLPELHNRIKPFMLRRTKQEVLEELPARNIMKIEFEATKKVLAAIKAEEAATIEASGESDPQHFKLGEIIRIRQAVAKYKIPDAVEFIHDLLDSGEKVVVFFHHHEILRQLCAAFEKTPHIFITGDDSAKRRQTKVDSFINEHVPLFFGQMQACGEGVDGLQHAASTCVFVEPSWSPTDIEQCVSRLERMGQKKVINAYILVIKGTIESDMMDLVLWKQKNINTILGTNTEILTTPTQKELNMEGPCKPAYLEDRLAALEAGQAKIKDTIATIHSTLGTIQVLMETLAETAKPTSAPKESAPKASAKPKAAAPKPVAQPAPQPADPLGDLMGDEAPAPQPVKTKEEYWKEIRDVAAACTTKYPDNVGYRAVKDLLAKYGAEGVAQIEVQKLPEFLAKLKAYYATGKS